MQLTYSLNPHCVGKDHTKLGLLFTPVTTDLDTFIDTHYIQGQCIASGVFLTGYRNNENWLYSSMVIIDIDENLQSIEEIISQPFVQSHCFAAVPSSSHTPDDKKYHLYFSIDRAIDNEKYYRRFVEYVSGQIEATTDAAMAKPAQPCYGTVFSKPEMVGHVKGIGDGLLLVNRGAVPLEYATIHSEIKRRTSETEPIDTGNLLSIARNHTQNEAVSKRAERHQEQPPEIQERVTLSALKCVLAGWGRQEYNLWLALVMSSYAGCNSPKVLDYILNHPDIQWDTGEKKGLLRWWQKHLPKQEDGYTVATLFLFARHKGWLQTTSIDLKEYQEFRAQDVGEWFLSRPELPRHCIINSGLGTAKTLGSIKVIKALGIPKSVFFAPSIKLCTNLSAVLTAHGVTNTLYIDRGIIKDSDELTSAQVLVTTLQSFANRVIKKDVNMKDYKFVCIDESDELISSFARAETGGTLGFSSHVRKLESQWGFYALECIFEAVEYIYLLDGTATQISQSLADRFLILDTPIDVYKNTWIRSKASVYMLDSIYEARKVAIDAIEAGLQTVIAADTRRECSLIYEYVLSFDLVEEDQVILITGETHNQTDVQEFFKDVEAGAVSKKVVIYNSAMGSGVSIVDTKPAVFVQICAHLSPRKNLQLLNRYRQQSVVYIYTQRGENLYHTDAQERIKTVETVVENEQALTGLTYKTRTNLADIIRDIARLSVIDEYEQRRSYRDMYIGLLRGDGRDVSEPLQDIVISPEFKHNFKQARDLIETKHEQVLKHWRSIPPINREQPPPQDIPLLDYAKGLLHTKIDNYIPENQDLDINDYDLAVLVTTYGRNIRLLERYLQLGKALKTTLDNSQNSRAAMTTYKLYLSRLETISQLGLLFENSVSVLDIDELRPLPFLRAIELRKPTYDLIARRQERGYNAITRKFDDSPEDAALSIAKELLKAFGLRLKRSNGKHREDGTRVRKVAITGNEDVMTLLSLRGHDVDHIDFDVHKLLDYSTQIKPLADKFADLDNRDQRDVMSRLKDSVLTFEESIDLTDSLF